MPMPQLRWPGSHSCSLASAQPRIKKFASVLPTRIVHRKRSGFSRKPWSSFAERLPVRASRRTRSRFSANTPASMPESKNESSRHEPSTTQESQLYRFGSILFEPLHQQFANAAFVHDLGGEFQIPECRRLAGNG